ncbi:MarR family winged helix-turn-helix transcriptional regulator [Romboutsia sp.]|uniref:MarR family winged helix-turn-helix transcriptional regulator n=1 Tax=Romboutsia sp. TaxID=1965302 RepID=UPI003F2C1118
MKINEERFEKDIFNYIEKIKNLLSPQIWQNILLDCSKNEIFVLWLLHINKEVNMTEIAKYINAPLNTATGIISRMEKKNLVLRQRSIEDKRIVTIKLGESGDEQIQAILKEFMYYGQRVIEAFSEEEIKLFFSMMNKLTDIMMEEREKEKTKSKIRKISID